MELKTEHTARFKIDRDKPDEFGITWSGYTVYERKQGLFGPYWAKLKSFDSIFDARRYVNSILDFPEYYG